MSPISRPDNEPALQPEIESLLRELRGVLSYHLLAGVESYPATDMVQEFMRRQPGASPPERVTQGRTAAVGSQEGMRKPGAQRRGEPKPEAPRTKTEKIEMTSLDELSDEIATCSSCGLSKNRVVPVAGRGASKARLLIVGDWLALPQGKVPPAGCVFGVEQDRMLGKMLEAIRVPREEVFITNVIKCGIPDSSQPRAEHVHACISFLNRQLITLAPEAILCMGLIATRAMLDRRESLSRLRGRPHQYCTPNGTKIPLVATYHPTYLLQNPEMKRATWQDLQLLANRLGIRLG